MTAPALHDQAEARSLARIDSALARGPVVDPTRALGSAALRELSRDRALPRSLRERFAREAATARSREEDARRGAEWLARHPVDVFCDGCAGLNGSHWSDCARAE